MRALFQHDTLIGGNAQCHQRRNSVSDGDAHKRTLKRELQWLSTLCHRLGVTRARCSTSELLQLQCYEGYAMKKCVAGVKYMPTDAMPTARLCTTFVNVLSWALFNFGRSAHFASLWKAPPISMTTDGSGPLIQVFLGWKILTDKCSPLKILWEVVY